MRNLTAAVVLSILLVCVSYGEPQGPAPVGEDTAARKTPPPTQKETSPGNAEDHEAAQERARKRAEKKLEQLQEAYGQDCRYQIDHVHKLIVVASSVFSEAALAERIGRLGKQADALGAELFDHPLQEYVTVILPDEEMYKKLNKGKQRVGFYEHKTRRIIVLASGLELTHEFTHTLHRVDQEAKKQKHPIWITEGLATFCETSEIVEGKIVPKSNERIYWLKFCAERNRTIPWTKLVKQRGKGRDKLSGLLLYPQARHMFIHFHQKGLLKPWYKAYTRDYKKDKTGVKALEKVFEKPLAQIEKDWLDWVKKKEAPEDHLPSGHACLGVNVARCLDGIRILDLIAQSSAEKAGLKVGDVITRMDGQRLVDTFEKIVSIELQHSVGDEVKVEYRRDGKAATAVLKMEAVAKEHETQLESFTEFLKRKPRKM